MSTYDRWSAPQLEPETAATFDTDESCPFCGERFHIHYVSERAEFDGHVLECGSYIPGPDPTMIPLFEV